jgi:hypothetical protein
LTLTPIRWMIAVLLLVALGAGLTLGTHWPKWAAYLEAEAAAELAEQEAAWRQDALSREDARVAARLEKEYWEEYGPVVFSQTVEAPMSGAKRDVSVSSAWGGVLEAPNQGVGFDTLINTSPCQAASLTGLGATASVAGYNVVAGGGNLWRGDAVNPGWPVLYGLYWAFQVTVSAGGDSDSSIIAMWVHDFEEGETLAENNGDLPEEAIIVDSLAVTAAATLSNVYVRGYRQGLTVSGRQRMDATDFRGLEQWYANENSEVTVTATGPGGLSLSANGAYGSYASETALGINPFSVTYAFTVNSFPTTEPLARVSSITLGDVEIGSAPTLWYAPSVTPGSTPSDVPANWSRLETDADAHKIRVDCAAGQAEMRRDGTALSASRSYSELIRAAYAGRVVFLP